MQDSKRVTFQDVIVEGNIDSLARVVPSQNQEKFCCRMRNDFKSLDGKTPECFEWAWRCFKAMRSLLLSAALYVDSSRSREEKYLDALYCYGLYYSLFHASFSLTCMHPEVKREQLSHVSHKHLMNLIADKFVTAKVLPESYLDILERAKIMRELTSYFAPLGGLANSTSPDIKDINLAFEKAKEHLAYAFQLCNVLGSIYWRIKDDCSGRNRSKCEDYFKSHRQDIGDEIEKLVNYQTFPSAKIWGSIGELEFDQKDAETAVRKFGLYKMCPTPQLQYMTLDIGDEEFHIENEETRKRFDEFMRDVW